MLSSFVFSAVSLGIITKGVLAQQGAWAQCGGIGWTGGTTCVSGYACTYSNDYYSQCIPGIGTTSSSIATTSTSATGPAPSSVKANYWFSFGDSYTQTGFTTTDTLPTPEDPLGNPPYPGYTAVGGVNWIDQATTVSNHSLVLTYNYAYGGATIDASLVTPYEPTVLSLTDQVNEFLSQANVGTGTKIWTSSNALFSVWIGINDIGNSYYLGGDRAAFSDTLLNAYFALIEKLLLVCTTVLLYGRLTLLRTSNTGARNFLFINVPPVDRSPMMVAQGTSATSLEKSVIAGFNSKLAARVSNLTSTHSGAKTWLWDSNARFSQILDNPTAFGFIDNSSYGNTGDFWGNNYHPSSGAQVIFGNDIGSLLSGSVW